MQRMIPIEGTLSGCEKCGRQPKHWLDMRSNGGHSLECSPCAHSTPAYPTFQQAVDYWESRERLKAVNNVR